MDDKTKNYIDNLSIDCIPWHRMFTAYGTAENFGEALSVLEQTDDIEEWNDNFDIISDCEHQSTMCSSAPFVLIFLVRILEKRLSNQTKSSGVIVKSLIKSFLYYIDICNEAENMEHAQPLSCFSDMLEEKYLLPENIDEEELEEIFEDPDAVPDNLFYSFYYYSKMVLSQLPDILKRSEKYAEMGSELKNKF